MALAKHGRGVTARARAAVLKAFDLVDDASKGYKPIPELLAEAAQKDVFRFMDVTAKYIIKDMNTDMDGHKALSELSNEELAQIVSDHARKQREALQQEHSASEAVRLAVDNQAKTGIYALDQDETATIDTVGQNMVNK